jgi:hypothetical protein
LGEKKLMQMLSLTRESFHVKVCERERERGENPLEIGPLRRERERDLQRDSIHSWHKIHPSSIGGRDKEIRAPGLLQEPAIFLSSPFPFGSSVP